VVGSLAHAADLSALDPTAAAAACDVVEIRLDGLAADGVAAAAAPWRHLAGLPLLFTARRGDQGGAGALDVGTRARWLEAALPDAAWLDIEAASLAELAPIVATARAQGVGLVVSHHDFDALPDLAVLERVVQRAREAGAAVAKVAARIERPAELAWLADFTLADHGIAVATMGMGRLAAVSRLLCAQCGSVFNYGYLGRSPTAPGQWPAARLRQWLVGLEQGK
jgi:3-dehydroquinate dehydratase-1